MFICDLCHNQQKPRVRMFKVPDKAERLTIRTPTGTREEVRTLHEAKLCPDCRAKYEELLKGTEVNPQSAYAALLPG
jgi:hypothetical protein